MQATVIITGPSAGAPHSHSYVHDDKLNTLVSTGRWVVFSRHRLTRAQT